MGAFDLGSMLGGVGLGGGVAGTSMPGPTTAATTTGLDPALQQQQALVAALQAQNGLGNQSSVYNQLQNVANGTGPNPAQAMLAQQTGANIASQGAMMAGQRGASANPGLMARQAAQQGGALQQQAVGQGATMQANQSLNALGQMQGEANTMAGQQIGATTANTQSQQANQNAANEMQSNINNNNAAIAQGQQKQAGSGGGLGSIMGAASSLAPMAMMLNQGGSVPAMKENYAEGGNVLRILQTGNAPKAPAQPAFSMGGRLKQGGPVPGQAKVKGDNLKNDTVAARLSPGEVVIPRSITKGSDPVNESAKFVARVLSGMGSGKAKK